MEITELSNDSSVFKKHITNFKKNGGCCQLLALEDISQEDLLDVSMQIFRKIKGSKDENDMYKRYLSILTSNGIICPHPMHKRSYPSDFFNSRWYDCSMCDCIVVNNRVMGDKDDEETADDGRNKDKKRTTQGSI